MLNLIQDGALCTLRQKAARIVRRVSARVGVFQGDVGPVEEQAFGQGRLKKTCNLKKCSSNCRFRLPGHRASHRPARGEVSAMLHPSGGEATRFFDSWSRTPAGGRQDTTNTGHLKKICPHSQPLEPSSRGDNPCMQVAERTSPPSGTRQSATCFGCIVKPKNRFNSSMILNGGEEEINASVLLKKCLDVPIAIWP